MGGVLRVLRHGIGLPLAYRLDANDETILSRRQASVLSHIAVGLMVASYSAWMRATMGLAR